MGNFTDKLTHLADFLFGCCDVPMTKSSQKITQRMFNCLPIKDGFKTCPTGDYTNVKCFGNFCKFGNHCTFSSNSIFGDDCRFGLDCSFGPYCKFGDRCRFGDNCNAREYCEFKESFSCGINCSFGFSCVFGRKSVFKDFCMFGDHCVFKNACSVGNHGHIKPGSRFYKKCDLIKCNIGKDCEFENGCEFWDCSFMCNTPLFGCGVKFYGNTVINYMPVKKIMVIQAMYEDNKHIIVGVNKDDMPIVFYDDFQGPVKDFLSQSKCPVYNKIIPEVAKALLQKNVK